MLVSYNWLSEHFNKPLPEPSELARILTLQAFEVENVESTENGDTVFDIDVLPNRASDCLCHYGIAKEIGTLLDRDVIIPSWLQRETPESFEDEVQVHVTEPDLCGRYIARKANRVISAESPVWVKNWLQNIGQKPINMLVDITNIVMFEFGQPMHVFDADKLDGEKIFVRTAKAGERITTLDGKEVELNEKTLVISDEKDPIAIAGVKGGKKAEVDGNTKNIILESANFGSVSVRRTSARLGIRTDSSKRFENEISPELAACGMQAASSLLNELSEESSETSSVPQFGELHDQYPKPANYFCVGVNTQDISEILGVELEDQELETLFERLGFLYENLDVTEKLLELAPKYTGAPYRYGASVTYDTPRFFDSSSLIAILFSRCGVGLPRMLIDQYVFSASVPREELEPGDIVFANTGEEVGRYQSIEWMPGTKVLGGVDHAGIYLGDGKIIHASRFRGKVEIDELKTSKQFANIIDIRRVIRPHTKRYVITPPSSRLDIRTLEDVAEEVGRVYGYDKIPSEKLPSLDFSPEVNKTFRVVNEIKNLLTGLGFSEVLTHTFQKSGKVEVKNPSAQDRAYLRENLITGMREALSLNVKYTPLLGVELVKIFEIGNVFNGSRGDLLHLGIGVADAVSKKDKRVSRTFEEVRSVFQEKFGVTPSGEPSAGVLELPVDSLLESVDSQPDSYENALKTTETFGGYQPFSPYPFILRDIAVFIPEEEPSDSILEVVREEAGDLLVNTTLFDVFPKEFEDGAKKISYAYHLVFQSHERTLSNEEINKIMKNAEDRLNSQTGFSVR